MLSRTIPSSGEELPVLGLGTWQTFDVEGSARAALEPVLQEFVSLGGKLIDSSPMYGRSEEVVGDLLRKLGLHPRVFLATKVWTTGKAAGLRQMEESERKLRGRVDLMQVHNLLDVQTHLESMRGRFRYLGVTHYTASAHSAVADLVVSEKLDFIQINYSLAEPQAEKRLLGLAHDRGVAVIANRPFGGGGLLARLRAKPLPGLAAELGCSTWAALLLKWVISHPAVTCAIPATSKVAHLRENMAAARGPLPDEKMRQQIRALLSV